MLRRKRPASWNVTLLTMTPPRTSPRNRAAILFVAVVAATSLVSPLVTPLAGQTPGEVPGETPDRFRLGVNLGGTALIGISFEFLRGNYGYEAVLGTLAFHDLSLSLSGKRYLGSGRLRPVVGIGLWGMAVWSEEGTGGILILRAPTAVEWRMNPEHAIGLEVGFNRGLWVHRSDPEDETPLRSSIIPFPGAYYRSAWER